MVLALDDVPRDHELLLLQQLQQTMEVVTAQRSRAVFDLTESAEIPKSLGM